MSSVSQTNTRFECSHLALIALAGTTACTDLGPLQAHADDMKQQEVDPDGRLAIRADYAIQSMDLGKAIMTSHEQETSGKLRAAASSTSASPPDAISGFSRALAASTGPTRERRVADLLGSGRGIGSRL